MNRRGWFNRWQWLGSIGIALLLVLFLQRSILAQSSYSYLDSRLNRLESTDYALQARISRLESDLARVSRSVGLDYSPPPANSGGIGGAVSSGGAPSALASDPTFQRLANLFIELKERVVRLENRVSELGGR